MDLGRRLAGPSAAVRSPVNLWHGRIFHQRSGPDITTIIAVPRITGTVARSEQRDVGMEDCRRP